MIGLGFVLIWFRIRCCLRSVLFVNRLVVSDLEIGYILFSECLIPSCERKKDEDERMNEKGRKY